MSDQGIQHKCFSLGNLIRTRTKMNGMFRWNILVHENEHYHGSNGTKGVLTVPLNTK